MCSETKVAAISSLEDCVEMLNFFWNADLSSFNGQNIPLLPDTVSKFALWLTTLALKLK